MRKLILFLIPFFLFAEGNLKYKITAENIIFNNNNLHFKNGFYLEHSFGKIFANKAHFTNFKKGSLFDFILKDGVKLITNTNGVLTSDKANFDSFSSKIKFYSDDYVNYEDQIKKKI